MTAGTGDELLLDPEEELVECDNCGELVDADETETITVTRATRLEPADELTLCANCAELDDGPDEPEWSNLDPEPPAGWEP